VNSYPLGFSTSWNAAGIPDGRDIVTQITDLGFHVIEVEYRVSEGAVTGIEEAVREGEIRVASVHNYAPLVPNERASNRGGDKRNLASPDSAEREEAVKLTLRSLGLARRLGAEVLVLHLGETDMGRAYFREIVDVVQEYGPASDRAAELRDRLKKARNAVRDAFLDAAVLSLKDLIPHAEDAGVILGIENRYYYHQVPLPEEVPMLLGALDSSFLCYWHDIGHAHVMDALGFAGHLGVLDLLKGNLLGMHIHDAVFIKDHRAPGTGEVDFRSVLERAGDVPIRILELSSVAERADIVKSVPLMQQLGLYAPKP
jgi:sugar phosphate isomerase/epimerase